MSNVKRVEVQGVMPYDCAGNETIRGWLASMNTPTFGLRIRWGKQPVEMRNNEHGGKTAMFAFEIQGEEAVAFTAYDTLLKAITECGGRVNKESCIDLEAARDSR